MQNWIDTRATRDEAWWRYEGNADGLPALADLLLPVEAYAESRALWHARPGRLGLLIGPGEDPQRLAPWLDSLDLVAVEFTRFADGRGFTIGRLLRDRLHWAGALAATGELIPDQVPMLARCGFDRFELPDPAQARRALTLLANDPVHRLMSQTAAGRLPLPGTGARRRLAAH
ncbi:MAG: DUF934 domain-containing protein [Burkholderiaceae bacterium]